MQSMIMRMRMIIIILLNLRMKPVLRDFEEVEKQPVKMIHTKHLLEQNLIKFP